MKTYIYCTKAKPYLYYSETDEPNYLLGDRWLGITRDRLNGKVCIECDIEDFIEIKFQSGQGYKDDEYVIIDKEDYRNNHVLDYDIDFMNKCCLEEVDFYNYGKGKDLYGLNLKNVKPVDIELSEFNKIKLTENTTNDCCENIKIDAIANVSIKKAPQSYCYAYYKGERVLLMSIKSKYACEILNGNKTVEVRTRCPKEIGGKQCIKKMN